MDERESKCGSYVQTENKQNKIWGIEGIKISPRIAEIRLRSLKFVNLGFQNRTSGFGTGRKSFMTVFFSLLHLRDGNDCCCL